MKRQWILIIAITIIIAASHSEIIADDVERLLATSTAASQNYDELLEINPAGEILEDSKLAAVITDNTDKSSYLIKKSSQISENKNREKIIISAQREYQLIITTGDLVYLKTSGHEKLSKTMQYIIYKEVTKKDVDISKKTTVLYEPVGKLRILEINQPLSLAKVVTARGVIQKGDFIFSGKQP